MKKLSVMFMLSCINIPLYGAEARSSERYNEERLVELCQSEEDNPQPLIAFLDQHPEALEHRFLIDLQTQLERLGEELQQEEDLHQEVKELSDNPPFRFSSPLSLVCSLGKLSTTQALLKRISKSSKQHLINVLPGSQLEPPLLSAICSGNPKIVAALLNTDADPTGWPLPDMNFTQYAGLFCSPEGYQMHKSIISCLNQRESENSYSFKKATAIHKLVTHAAVTLLKKRQEQNYSPH